MDSTPSARPVEALDRLDPVRPYYGDGLRFRVLRVLRVPCRSEGMFRYPEWPRYPEWFRVPVCGRGGRAGRAGRGGRAGRAGRAALTCTFPIARVGLPSGRPIRDGRAARPVCHGRGGRGALTCAVPGMRVVLVERGSGPRLARPRGPGRSGRWCGKSGNLRRSSVVEARSRRSRSTPARVVEALPLDPGPRGRGAPARPARPRAAVE